MTQVVVPSIDRLVDARPLSKAILRAGSGEYVVPDGTDIVADTLGLSGTPLGGFTESHSASSFDVTIDTGEAFVGGSYLAKDTQTTVTLASSTNNQDVYLGWNLSASDEVIIGKSGDFAGEDPKIKIHTFDTDGSGVTSSTDQRKTDDTKRVTAYDESLLQDGNSKELDLDQFAGGNGTAGQVPKSDGSAIAYSLISNLISDGDTDEMDVADFAGGNGTANQAPLSDGSAVSWSTLSTVLAEGGGDAMDAADFSGASGSNGQVLQTDGTSASWANAGGGTSSDAASEVATMVDYNNLVEGSTL